MPETIEMPTDDRVEVDLGIESTGDKPLINTVSIRCEREGELLLERNCQNMEEVEDTRSVMERNGFATGELDARPLDVEEHFGMARELCRGCGATLFRKNRLPHGGWAMDPNMSRDLQSEGGELFFRCERCGGRNYVVSTSGAQGPAALEIQRFEK